MEMRTVDEPFQTVRLNKERRKKEQEEKKKKVVDTDIVYTSLWERSVVVSSMKFPISPIVCFSFLSLPNCVSAVVSLFIQTTLCTSWSFL